MKSKLKIIIPTIIAIVIIVIIGMVFIINNKSITLTNENYNSYLKISANASLQEQYTVYLDTDYKTNYTHQEEQYQKIYLSVGVEGLSNNFIYEDVEVDVSFSATCPLSKLATKGMYNSRMAIIRPTFTLTKENQNINKTITVKCDVSGNEIYSENNSFTIELPKDRYVSKDILETIERNINVRGKVKEVK